MRSHRHFCRHDGVGYFPSTASYSSLLMELPPPTIAKTMRLGKISQRSKAKEEEEA